MNAKSINIPRAAMLVLKLQDLYIMLTISQGRHHILKDRR